MQITDTTIVSIPLSQLVCNEGQIDGVPANPRILRDEKYRALVESLRADNLTGINPLKVYAQGDLYVVLGGNMRLRALQEIGATDCPCIEIPQATPTEILRKIVVLDNSTFGEWDWDMLANEWDDAELKEWGVDVPELTAEEKAEYSRKVESPTYEPTAAVAPSISECVDLRKYEELCSEIDGAEIDDEEKRFLKIAAARHIVFDYRNIAERYAHSPKEVQALMEKSALVIIDFGSAIEEGFVKMSKRLQTLIPEK